MNTVAFIVDHSPAFLDQSDCPRTLMSVPLGAADALFHLVDRCRDVGVGDIWVVRPAADGGGAAKVDPTDSPEIRVTSFEGVPAVLAHYEASDVAVVIDARYWPSNQFDLAALFEQRPDVRWSSHAVCIGRALDATVERIEQDAAGRVCRVQRVYDLVTWPRSGPIAASLIPMSALTHLDFGCPAKLRVQLVADGFLSSDASIASSVLDLTEPAGLLTLSDNVITELIEAPPPPGFSRHRPTVLVGGHCQIHPSVKLIGPIVIHDHVTVDRGATIIGPTVIGSHCRIEEKAAVAQSVVCSNSRVCRSASVRHHVVSGKMIGQRQRREAPDASSFLPRHGPRAISAWEPSVGDIRNATDRRSHYLASKYLSDTILASLALIVLSPLFAVLALLIKLGSSGPVFYRDKREGKDGRDFDCLKFRSMREDAHQQQRELYGKSELDGPQFKLPDDPRVTRVGRLLRSTNLDELPQLINVALGQMSLVGPRPSPFRENQICVPWRRARLSVRPGITGLWQICRHDRDAGDFHQWIAYDIAYVRNMSLWLDVKILAATVLTLGGRWNIPSAVILGRSNSPLQARQAVRPA